MVRPVRETVRPGQESVWDYPRPSVAQATDAHLRVVFRGRVVAETRRGVRTIETSHPPSFYFPPDDVDAGMLRPNARRTFCEWKGVAAYLDVVAGAEVARAAAWGYAAPTAAFRCLAGFIAFYPAAMDECTVDGAVVRPQLGRFYGGWITDAVAGPFKGAPGSEGW